MPESFGNCTILPERFEVPESLIYKYMIWRLAKYYSLNPADAGKLKENDFWIMTAFEELEISKTEYLINLRRESN